MLRAIDHDNYFRIPADTRDLNYQKYFEKGEKKLEEIESYTSDNTQRLNKKEMKKLLIKMGEIEI